MINRRMTKPVKLNSLTIGGGERILIQSMLNLPPDNIEANIIQAKALLLAGCDIIRIAVPDLNAIPLISELKESVSMPIVADIHFDYKIALACVDAGIDKIRINPGNIGSDEKVKLVVKKCLDNNIPIRVGVNSGSLEKEILAKYSKVTANALCESAMHHVSILEKFDFNDIVISIKSSDVLQVIEAYEMLSEITNYPLHLGVTEAGTENMGIIKSSIGIGSLLAKGIGDTIRVSLTADPVREVIAAKNILKALNLNKSGIDIISCPTCGRTKMDLIELTNRVEKALVDCNKKLKVAIMGCAVNGPGEAMGADVGVAGGDGCGLLFKKGKIIEKVPEDKLFERLIEEIERM